MSRLLLFVTPNLFHSNVSANKRRELIEQFDRWMATMRGFPVPVVTGLAELDRFILSVYGHDVDDMCAGLHAYGTTFNHALMSLFPARTPLFAHGRFLLNGGTPGNTDLFFYPEYDIPASPALQPTGKVIPVLPDKHSVLYSECMHDGQRFQGGLEGARAFHSGKNVLVPMWGVEDLQRAFFLWQRYPDIVQYGVDLAHQIRAFSQKPGDDIRIFFMDLEAPLVGSHHGMTIWQRFAELILAYGLTDVFAGPAEAVAYWRNEADQSELSRHEHRALIARNLGVKWTGLAPQMHYIQRWMWDSEYQALNRFEVATQSDVLSAMHRKLVGSLTLSADKGDLPIGYDPTIIAMGEAALSGPPLNDVNFKIHDRDMSDVDRESGLWFARLVERTLQGLPR